MKNREIYNRHSIRLKGYDYSQDGAYFLTICTKNGELYFEKYPALRGIINHQWHKIPSRFSSVKLDESMIMPNHIHGIIFLVGATLAVAPNNRTGVKPAGAGVKPAPTVGKIVGEFKSLCVNDWLKYIEENKIDAIGKFWQRNYYERIIRNEEELKNIREYIINNPLKWEMDKENPKYLNNKRNPIYYKISGGFPTYKCDFRFKSDIDDLVHKFGFKSETGDLNE